MKKAVQRMALATPVLGRLLLWAYRAKIALSYILSPAASLPRWLLASKETTNFTYDLHALNRNYLAALIAEATRVDLQKILAYFSEIENDQQLKDHVARAVGSSDLAYASDTILRLGSRIGWYAFARAMKPRVILETGVDKGLGACILCAALQKNEEEGYPGKYFGTDIDEKAGYLLTGIYARFGSILYGDSIDSINKLDVSSYDLVVDDSGHFDSTGQYEAREYEALHRKLSSHAVILSQSAHFSGGLFDYSLRAGRCFLFFQEKPNNHWYPGGGLGVSFFRHG